MGWLTQTLNRLDLSRLRKAVGDVDWRSLRDLPRRGVDRALDATMRTRRGDPAARRSGVVLAAVGATLGAAVMYFFDSGSGSTRRASARAGVTRLYLAGRAQIDRARRRLRSEGRTADRPTVARVRDHTAANDGRPSREEAVTASR